MDATYAPSCGHAETDFYQEIESLIKKDPRAWQSVCAVLGLAGGVVAPFLGAVSDVITWFVNSNTMNSSLHVLSIVFCALTIPLLALGGVCLDLLEAKTNRLAPPIKPLREESSAATVMSHTAQQKGNRRIDRSGAVAVLVFLLALPSTARAQQTIFNVPTTDVLDRGKVYAELDASFKPNDSEAVPRFSSFVPRVVVGAGGRVEVGLNVAGNVQPGPDSTTLVPTIKYKFYDGKENGFAIVGGDHLFIPVRNRAYRAGNYVYLEVSKTFKTGTRLTAGGYDFTRNVVAPANRAGGQLGFEQPAGKKLTLAADWFTGKHAAGYFTPGAVFKLNPKLTGYAGYSLGNSNLTRGNHFFLLELGYNFD